jgi:hypothetical protein
MGHEAPIDAAAHAVVRSLHPGPSGSGRTAQARLGFGELPSSVDRLAPGMIYGVACAEQAVRVPLISSALAASLAGGTPCVLLTPASPRVLLGKSRLAGFALQAPFTSGDLSIFQVAGDAAKHLFRLGAETLIAELERHIPAREALIVIDEADALFMLCDPRTAAEATHHYLEWAAKRNHTLLAVFAPTPQMPRDYLTLRRVAENFAGFGLATPAAGGAILEVRHWFGADGLSGRESFELRLNSGGERPATRTRKMPEPDDALAPGDLVVCAAGAVGSLSGWKWWESVESVAEAVQVARRSEAATLIFPFERPSDFEQICKAVLEVRALERAGLRILVRERALRLRASQAVAIMRLGVSSVIPAEVPDAAVKRMADALRGTRFTRPYDAEFRQVEEETVGLLRARVWSRRSFCDAAERLLAASEGFDIESCLVRIEAAGIEPWNLLTQVRRHTREVLAADDAAGTWLFLYGCRAENAPLVIKRVLAPLALEAEAKWLIHPDANRILNALDELRSA